MTLFAYKIVHLVGLMLLFGALGGLAVLGGAGVTGDRAKPFKGVLNAFHGLGLLLLVVGGFGLLAKLGVAKPADWGGWVHAKMVMWLVFGAAIVPLKRKPELARIWLLLFVVLGGITAWLGVSKPF